MTVNNPGPIFRKLYRLANQLSRPQKENTSDVLDRLLKDFGANYSCDLLTENINLKQKLASSEAQVSGAKWTMSWKEREIAQLKMEIAALKDQLASAAAA
jgi:hypothetical protein